jgi:Tfp pilus assembly protein PilN
MSQVQFNLLPDVKLNYVKAQRTRNLIISVSTISASVAIAIFLLSFFLVKVVQKAQMGDLDKNIQNATKSVKDLPDIDKVLTIQNQLTSLVGLHQQKHISSRIFTYLPEVTPSSVNVGNVTIDFVASTMNIAGTADSQKTVNAFIDNLKTTYYSNGGNDKTKAFSQTTESSFSIQQKSVNFTINLVFDPSLFSNATKDSLGNKATPQLLVPKLTTTHLDDQSSDQLFKGNSR